MRKPKTGYCWKCADEFPMAELVEDDDPYIKDELDPNDKNYQCRPCEARDCACHSGSICGPACESHHHEGCVDSTQPTASASAHHSNATPEG